MTRHVFFSFKYDPDVWRVNAIRNQVHVLGSTSTGYWDDSIYEQSLAQNSNYICRKIREALEGTTVTVILVTSSTHESGFVKYEYEKSIERKNGILQLNVSRMKDQYGRLERFDVWLPYINRGFTAKWVSGCPLGDWIEQAFNKGS
jgi:hypothetical protein